MTPRPRPQGYTFHIYSSSELRDRVAKHAEAIGLSLSEWGEQALREKLRRDAKKIPGGDSSKD